MDKNIAIDPHQYIPLVKSIVERLDVTIPGYWDKDDVIGYGIIGLMEAAERFRPDQGAQFATYASQRIKGSILDALRKASPLSRNCWQKVRIITEAMERFSMQTGQEAPMEEIIRAVNMDREEIEEALQSFKLMTAVSLEQSLGFEGLTISDTLETLPEDSPVEAFLRKEQKELLSKAIETLEERQRMVLNLYYYEELRLQEIAMVLDISVSRVSQLKTMALAALRRHIEG